MDDDAADHPCHKNYEIQRFLGEGTSGVVHQARRRTDNTLVAIKQIRRTVYKHGVDGGGLREVKILQELAHPNVCRLFDVQGSLLEAELYLVLEFCETDLKDLIMSDETLHAAHIKAFMRMILTSLEYIHSRWK